MTAQSQDVAFPLIAKLLSQAVHHPDGFKVEQALHSGKAGSIQSNVQEKLWGWELWLVYIRNKYALKVLHVNQGERLSLQRHEKKEESWFVLMGHPELRIGDETFRAEPGDRNHIPTGTIHRISAPEDDVEILEVSTPELWDVVRIEDDYGRK